MRIVLAKNDLADWWNQEHMATGVLLIHGFSGSRDELLPLKSHLEKCGFKVSLPVLAGHESTRQDFAQSKYTDWIRSAEEAAADLEKSCGPIIIVGFSMGGVITVNLYRKIAVQKLVFINTPIYYWNIARIVKNLTGDFKTYFRKYFTDSNPHPLPALLEFRKIVRQTKPLFSKINCPVLIIQTIDDDTVKPKSADYIYRNVAGAKFLKKYAAGGHQFFATAMAEDVYVEVVKFIGELGNHD
ncbi:MAG: alpha/beta fold hydrolase [Firmicutes bacterium]|nr:alpha/beta fold hydrolase [Bacillota bacterium]